MPGSETAGNGTLFLLCMVHFGIGVMRTRFFCLTIFLFAVSVVQAQDFETARPSTDLPELTGCPLGCIPADDEGSELAAWDKNLGVGFSYTDGNANTSDLNVTGMLSRDYERNIWDFRFVYSYGEGDQGESADTRTDRSVIKNQALADATYKRLLNERLFVGAGSSFRYDEIAEIDYRVNAGIFVGMFLVRNDAVRLSVELGPSHVFEQVGGVYNQYMAPRFGNTLEWEISSTARLFQSAELLLDASDSENYIINGELGLESAINSMFSVIMVFREAYDNQPAEGLVRNDLAFITSLNMTF